MKDFPDFMKSKINHISSKEQNTEDIDGYFYEGADGTARWISGPVIRTGFPRNMLMNLMSTWFVLVASIQQY